MRDKDTHDTTDGTGTDDGPVAEPDGGTVSQAAQEHQQTDYLDSEVNLLRPSTRFMRDHLKLVWGSFIAWILATWGPVTATFLAPETMTSLSILGFPAHYFLVGFFAPTSSLVLAAIYAHRRDKLDEKYGIDTSRTTETPSGPEEAAATDGGVNE
jgi:putative solute:sodium symporter small subunit